MGPSRELDCLVAEKVMGWRRVGDGWHTKPEHRPSKDFPGRILNNWDSKGPHNFLVPPGSHGGSASERVAFCGCDGDLEIPYYSSDIRAAWDVVDTMGFQLKLEALNHHRGYIAQFIPYEQVEAASAPHAICLAALRTLGIELDK